MSWYDVFANVYDASLEKQYADARARACAALDLQAGQVVVDAPCGTGQSFDGLVDGVGETGKVIGLDASAGMLRRAAARVQRNGWGNVVSGKVDIQEVETAELTRLAGGEVQVDRVHVFLGMSVFPDHQRAFERLWSLLTPGGRFAIVDCHAANPGLQGRLVNFMAGAEIRRRTWEPLEAVAEEFVRTELPSTWQHGGTLFAATGLKPSG